MKLKLQRIATFVEKFGLVRGSSLYLGLRQNALSQVRIPGIESVIYLRPGSSDGAIFDQVFLQDQYNLPLSFVPSVIVDIGAHIGLFSVLMKNTYPLASLYCIEPGEHNYTQLQKNMQDYKGVVTFQAALWHTKTMVQMLENQDLGHSGLQAQPQTGGNIPAVTMDDLFQRFGLDHIDILKIDIEAAETLVFGKGNCAWMSRVRMLVIELHDWLVPGCAAAFFEAVHRHYKQYRYHIIGENTVIENLDGVF
jgi:FkbM family methyltransferase